MTTPTVPVPHPIEVDDPYKQHYELAMLEGHDADIPTNDGPGASTKTSSLARDSSPSPPESDGDKLKDEEKGEVGAEHMVEEQKPEEQVNDPNIVSWNGPDDPDNPVNWKSSLKWANVAAISAITFITYVLHQYRSPNHITLCATSNLNSPLH